MYINLRDVKKKKKNSSPGNKDLKANGYGTQMTNSIRPYNSVR